MQDLELTWQRCGGEWCLLDSCDPPPYATGVYVIWEPLLFVRERRVVCVGQGAIGDCLARHRGDGNLTYYGKGSLLVTWAACLSYAKDGVVQFLAAAYRPYEGRFAPDAQPISVNLPIEAGQRATAGRRGRERR